MNDPTAVDLLKRAEALLSALHGSVARHDNIGTNLGCAGCELRDRIAAVLRRLADEAQPECIASISGRCLGESQSETACDTDAGECVHGGRPVDEAQQDQTQADVPAQVSLTRDQLAALLAHHTDVLAAQLRTDPARDAWIAAERLDAHAVALTADEETPAVAELLDSIMTFPAAPAVVSQPAPVHIGGRANAEDCPACEGTNPPYPFICPAPAVVSQPGKEAHDPEVVAYRSNAGCLLRCLAHHPGQEAVDSGDFYPVTSEDLPDGGVCTFLVTVDERCGVDVLIPQEADRA